MEAIYAGEPPMPTAVAGGTKRQAAHDPRRATPWAPSRPLLQSVAAVCRVVVGAFAYFWDGSVLYHARIDLGPRRRKVSPCGKIFVAVPPCC